MKAELVKLFRAKTTDARTRARTELDAWVASISVANEAALQAECAVTLPSNVDGEKALKLKIDARKADYVLLLPIIRVATSARRTVLASAEQALSKNAETKKHDVVMLEREWNYWEACYTREVNTIKQSPTNAPPPPATALERLIAVIKTLFDSSASNDPTQEADRKLTEAKRTFSDKVAPIQKKLDEVAKPAHARAIKALEWFKAHAGA